MAEYIASRNRCGSNYIRTPSYIHNDMYTATYASVYCTSVIHPYFVLKYG